LLETNFLLELHNANEPFVQERGVHTFLNALLLEMQLLPAFDSGIR